MPVGVPGETGQRVEDLGAEAAGERVGVGEAPVGVQRGEAGKLGAAHLV